MVVDRQILIDTSMLDDRQSLGKYYDYRMDWAHTSFVVLQLKKSIESKYSQAFSNMLKNVELNELCDLYDTYVIVELVYSR